MQIWGLRRERKGLLEKGCGEEDKEKEGERGKGGKGGE